MQLSLFVFTVSVVFLTLLSQTSEYVAQAQRQPSPRSYWSRRSCSHCFCNLCRNSPVSDKQLNQIYKGLFFTRAEMKKVKALMERRQVLYFSGRVVVKPHSPIAYAWGTSKAFVGHPGGFRFKREAINDKKRAKRETSMPSPNLQIVGDGDSCCPTFKESIDTRSQTTLGNVNGVQKTLVRLTNLNPPKYQMINTGDCGTTTVGQSCGGRCTSDKTIISLLVYDGSAVTGASFDTFEIPSYCSCKNIIATTAGK